MYSPKQLMIYLVGIVSLLTGCASLNNSSNTLDSAAIQQALQNGKAVVHLEWNYHGKQLYTNWLNIDNFNKIKQGSSIPFCFLTGNNKLTPDLQNTNEIARLSLFASKSGPRVAILEPGTYTLVTISPQSSTQRLGKDWLIFTYGLLGINKIERAIKTNDNLATFTVKAGEELYLPRVELVNDPFNFPKDDDFHITIENNDPKAYKIGKKLVVDPVAPTK